tara:strand:+ start:411 stop:2579 length:2169 start_codon:yes stop_codon:yes gene_type:complete
MALIRVPFESGINKQVTQTTAQSRWTDADFVRFRYGEPEKIGGWRQETNNTLVGVARDMHIWSDLNGKRYIAVGTHKGLFLYHDGAFYDISPLGSKITSGTITTTNNSSTVTINLADHNFTAGEIIEFSDVTIPGSGTGFTQADFINTKFEVTNIVNGGAFTVTMDSVESGTGLTAGGSIAATPYAVVGNASQVVGFGFGTGLWGGDIENEAFSTLNGALQDDTAGTGGSGTSITLTSASSFPSSGTIIVGAELITYTAKAGNDLQNITRAALGSTRSAHNSGVNVNNATNYVGWGSASDASQVSLEPGSWSLDNFGQILLATIKDGKTFEWDPSTGLTTRATVSTGMPTKSIHTIISDRDRHVIHLGTEKTIGNSGTQDPMFIRFSDQEARDTYAPTSTNTAGTFQLDSGTRIVGAVKGKDYILILTDTSAYRMQFVGPPFTFSITQVGSNCGAIGQHAAVFVDGAVYWMGKAGGFFVYDGTVKRIPCTVEDFVFSNVDPDDLGINYGAGNIVFAQYNSLFTEINWFYPKSGSTQNDRNVTFNYREGVWSISSLDRTTYYDRTVFDQPYGTQYNATGIPTFPVITGATGINGASILYEHEVGVDQVDSTGAKTAIPAFIESGDFDISDGQSNGEFFIKIRRFIPDFKVLSGNAKITLQLKDFPAQTETSSSLGPFTVQSSTNKIDTRARARFASLKIENNDTDENWRFGSFRADVQPDGRR